MISNATRNAELRQLLMARREQLQGEVQVGIRAGRDGVSKDVRDTGEDSDNIHQGDIAFSMLEMRAEMLTRIDEAVARVDAGQYGNCAACGCQIAEPRLRALPFAVRCRTCEDRREQAKRRVADRFQPAAFSEAIHTGPRS